MAAIPNPRSAFEAANSTDTSSENATRDRDGAGRFSIGNKQGRGRPKGSRTKLAEDVVSDVLESWRRDGPVVLARLASLDPGKYADFIAKVLPREVKVEHRMIDTISDEELQVMLDIAERMAAGAVIIEGSAVDVTPKALAAPAPRSGDAAGGVAVTLETLATPPSRSPGRDAAAAARRADLRDQAAAARRNEPARPAASAPGDIDPQTLF